MEKSNWTDEEIEFLKKNYKNMTQKELCEYLNKNRTSLQRKVKELNLKKPSKEWTQEDDDYLRNFHLIKTNKELANDLNRTTTAILNRISKLKLSKNIEEWKPEQLSFLKENYLLLSHEEIAEQIGKSRNAVRNKCSELKLIKKEPKWTDEEIKKLIQVYKEHEGKHLNLDELAKEFGRSRYGVAMKASKLGLTDLNRPMTEEFANNVGKRIKQLWKEQKHPKGMLGKTHSDELKKIMSERSKKLWADPNSVFHSIEFKEKKKILAKKSSLLNAQRLKENPSLVYSNARWGKRVDLDDQFYRSSWEANIARYLKHLEETGEIFKWEYEPDTYKFDDVNERPYSYTPDFKVWETSDAIPYYWEVKGWMDDLSKLKFERMEKYYPTVRIEIIDEKRYKEIKKQYEDVLPHWEKTR